MRLLSGAALGIAGLTWAQAAHAHLVNTGLGPFYDGVTHLVITPDEVLGVAALALLAGLAGAGEGRRLLATLPLAWLAAGLLGLKLPAPAAPPVVAAGLLVLIGVLVALDRRWPHAVLLAVALGFGGLHGYVNGSLLAAAPAGPAELLGIGAAVVRPRGVAVGPGGELEGRLDARRGAGRGQLDRRDRDPAVGLGTAPVESVGRARVHHRGPVASFGLAGIGRPTFRPRAAKELSS